MTTQLQSVNVNHIFSLLRSDMQYHISTGLIIEHFRNKCNCPLCEMEKKVEANICRELLADGCMDDDVRRQVNDEGFCRRHYEMLYEMPSKLGLALQMTTRLDTVLKRTLSLPTSCLKAKKQAKDIEKELSTCIVCHFTQKEMIKYYKTMAQLYANEAEFRTMIEESDGFCLRHYSKLLEYSDYAFLKSKDYLKALYDKENERLQRSKELLNGFSYRHDYRNAGKPLGDAAEALPRVKSDFFGKK